MIDYDSNTEISWFGTGNKFGKTDDFVIEHLVFDGLRILGYFSMGDSLCVLRGQFLDNAQSAEAATRGRGMMFRLEGFNQERGVKYEVRGYFDKLVLKCAIRDIPARVSPVILQLDMKSKPCTIY